MSGTLGPELQRISGSTVVRNPVRVSICFYRGPHNQVAEMSSYIREVGMSTMMTIQVPKDSVCKLDIRPMALAVIAIPLQLTIEGTKQH